MISLLITIITIALVAALAIATIFYMGGSQSKAFLAAEATEQINQGTQILGAMDLFKVDHDRWPDSLDELVSEGYLKTIPRIGITASKATIIAQANAQSLGPAWEMPMPGVPIAWVKPPEGGYTTSVCKEINSKARKYQGILKTMQISPDPQCFGKNLSNLRVVVSRSVADITAFAESYDEVVDSRSYPPVFDVSDPSWLIAPPETRAQSPEELDQPEVLVPQAGLTISSLSHDFGSLLRGQTAPSSPAFIISNTGTVNLTSLNISVTNSSEGYSLSSNCPVQLTPGENCQFQANFTALKDRSSLANIVVKSDQTQEGRILLTAAVQAPVLSWNNSFEFGTFNVGQTVFSTATLVNEGNYVANNLAINLSNSSNTTISIANNNCPTSLNPGQSCTVEMAHTPTTAGTRTGAAVLASADLAEPKNAAYSSTSLGFEFEWTGTSFGNVPINTSVERNFSLLNDGTANIPSAYVNLTANSTVQIVSNTCGTVSAPVALNSQATCTVRLRYTPVSAGVLTGAKITAHSGSVSKDYDLQGNAVLAATQGILEYIGPLSGIQFTSSEHFPGPDVNMATNTWRGLSPHRMYSISSSGVSETKALSSTATNDFFVIDTNRAIRFKNATTFAVYNYNVSTRLWEIYAGSEKILGYTRAYTTLRGQFNPFDGYFYILNQITNNAPYSIGLIKFRMVNSSMVDFSSGVLNLTGDIGSYASSILAVNPSRGYFGPDGWLYMMGSSTASSSTHVNSLIAINLATGQTRMVPYPVPAGYSITGCRYGTQCRLDFVFDSAWNILRQLNGQILLYPYQGNSTWGDPYPIVGTFRSTSDGGSTLTTLAGTGSAARVGAGFTLIKGPNDATLLIGSNQMWRIR